MTFQQTKLVIPSRIKSRITKDYCSLKEDSSGISLSHVQKIMDLENNISNCGKFLPFKCPNIECEEQGNHYRLNLRQYCMIRICSNPQCRSKRDRKIRDKYEPKLNSFNDPRFLTLTLKGYHPLNKQVLRRLNYGWKRMSLLLRRAGYLKAYVKVVELVNHEYVDATLTYHEVYFWHCHIVYDGTYIPAELLRSAWKRYTKDSHWLHVSRVKKNFSASAYIRKYLNKLSYDDMDVEEYYKVYKMKLISSYGCDSEIETILEIHILKVRLRCPFCKTYLIPCDVTKVP